MQADKQGKTLIDLAATRLGIAPNWLAESIASDAVILGEAVDRDLRGPHAAGIVVETPRDRLANQAPQALDLGWASPPLGQRVDVQDTARLPLTLPKAPISAQKCPSSH